MNANQFYHEQKARGGLALTMFGGNSTVSADAPSGHIVDGGYNALSAARILARNGLSVTVLEAREPGFGAVMRSRGMVGGGLKLPAELDRTLGGERADRMRKDARGSFAEFKQIIADEALEVDHCDSGRLTAAHTPAD